MHASKWSSLLIALGCQISIFAVPTGAKAADTLELNQPGTLSVCIVDSNAPMSSVVDGKLIGYEVSYSEAVAKRLGLKADFKFTVFEGIFAAVANHVCDMSAGSHSITIDRLKTINFSRPHFVGSYTILSKADSPVKTEKDLVGKRLGVVAASIQESYANETYKQTSVVPFPDSAALQISLLSGQVDAAFFDGGLAAIYLKEAPQPLREVISIPNTDQPAGLGIAKDRPHLLAAVNKAAEEIIADGAYKKIYADTIGGEAPALPPADFKPTR